VREPGAIVGEMSLFNPQGRRTASIRARTALRLIEIPRPEFEELLRRHPALSIELLRILSSRLEASENATILDLLEKNRQLAQAYQELKAAQAQIIEKEKLERELELARQIQRSVLPKIFPHFPGIQFGASIVPARAVGGDFYDFIPMRSGRIGIVVGDVSGKGVPASLFMSMTYSLIRAEAARTASASRALRAVNRHLVEMDVSSMFVTLFYGVLECSTREFSYVRAGHPPPLIFDGKGQAVEVPFKPGQPLGIFKQPLLDEQKITIPRVGLLLVYSDGLTEAFDAQGREFGTEGAQEVIHSHMDKTAQEICDRLWECVIDYSGSYGQQDDVTLLCLKSVSL
jgi:serine phosphatase RsbU (regulator of sigma subunit)